MTEIVCPACGTPATLHHPKAVLAFCFECDISFRPEVSVITTERYEISLSIGQGEKLKRDTNSEYDAMYYLQDFLLAAASAMRELPSLQYRITVTGPDTAASCRRTHGG